MRSSTRPLGIAKAEISVVPDSAAYYMAERQTRTISPGPCVVVMTGTPQAIASRMISGIPSMSVGKTNTSLEDKYLKIAVKHFSFVTAAVITRLS
jgi:hypothetical protein